MKTRKPNRLPDFNYSQNGYYFITICTYQKQNFFGKIKEEKIILNEYGRLLKERWYWLAKNFSYIKLDEFVVMPNHFHGVLVIENEEFCTDNPRIVPTTYQRRHNLLSKTINAFKTTSSKLIRQNGLHEFSWQRSFYDHVIRDEKKLNVIREYIGNNPIKLAIYKGLL